MKAKPVIGYSCGTCGTFCGTQEDAIDCCPNYAEEQDAFECSKCGEIYEDEDDAEECCK